MDNCSVKVPAEVFGEYDHEAFFHKVWGWDFHVSGSEYVGSFPIRQDITVLQADPPGKRLIGW